MSTPHAELLLAATAFHKAGVFGKPTEVTVEKVLVCLYLADADGQGPGAAVRDYSLVSGRPSKKAEAMLRSFLAAGGKVEWHESTSQKADATFSHATGGTLRVYWDMARKESSKINNSVYGSFPAQMLRARTIAEGCRAIYPAATGGLYTPEERQDMPSADLAQTEEHVVEAVIDAKLLEAAKETAAKGAEAFRAYWKKLSKGDRVTLQPKIDEFERASTAADAEAKALAGRSTTKGA